MEDTHNARIGARTSRTRGARRSPLRAEQLLELALKREKRRDFADRSFVEPFERLLMACHEDANLSAFGVRALRIDVLRCLRTILRFDEIEAASPSVLSRHIGAPIFITGMPRSGTTFLHRLILQDPGTAGPRLLQLVYPYASQGGWFAAARRKRWVGLQLSLFRMIARELNALHPIAIDSPEECTDITAHAFRSQRFDALYRIPSYTSWLERTGFIDAYRFHRRFLQHLDAQLPARRWVLKSPDHLFALDDLKKIYPDACLVLIHRDPVSVLASVAKLTEVLRRPFARSIDRFQIGREVTTYWLDGARRLKEMSANGDSALHLNYRQIVSQPLDAVKAVYRHCGLVLTEEAEGRMRNWLKTAGMSRTLRGYSLADYGLDPNLLRERFAPYTNTFGVEIEHLERAAGSSALV